MSLVSVTGRRNEASRLAGWLKCISGSLCVLMHRNADPDALSAAVGVRELIRWLAPTRNVRLVSIEGLDSLSKSLIEKVLPRISIDADLSECSSLILVDTSSTSQLGGYANLLTTLPYCIIDHHELNELVKGAEISIYDPNASSAAELVAGLMRYWGIIPSRDVSTLLIAGILYDSKHLRLAKGFTLDIVSWLESVGGDFEIARSALTSKAINWSEKVAILKGLSRAGLYRIGERHILAITCVGSHESLVLKQLLDSGADVGLAISRRKDHIRITIRATQKALTTIRSHLASDIAGLLARTLGGSGGGHAGAAGVLIDKSIQPDAVIEVLRKYFLGNGFSFRSMEEGRWMKECS